MEQDCKCVFNCEKCGHQVVVEKRPRGRPRLSEEQAKANREARRQKKREAYAAKVAEEGRTVRPWAPAASEEELMQRRRDRAQARRDAEKARKAANVAKVDVATETGANVK